MPKKSLHSKVCYFIMTALHFTTTLENARYIAGCGKAITPRVVLAFLLPTLRKMHNCGLLFVFYNGMIFCWLGWGSAVSLHNCKNRPKDDFWIWIKGYIPKGWFITQSQIQVLLKKYLFMFTSVCFTERNTQVSRVALRKFWLAFLSS